MALKQHLRGAELAVALRHYAVLLDAVKEHPPKRSRCIVHQGTESVVIIAYDLETGASLDEDKQYGLCRPCWKALAEVPTP